MTTNALDEILQAMRAMPEDFAARRSNEHKQLECKHALAKAFGALNGWRLTNKCFAPDDIGSQRTCIFAPVDHALFYRDRHRNVALVAQPYKSEVPTRLHAHWAQRGLRCHVPPNAFASFWYPGVCMFIVITRPETEVRWLPEQLAFEKAAA